MTGLWARALPRGVDDVVFWDATPAEVRLLLKEYAEYEAVQQREAIRRAGLITAAIYNVNRKKGARPLKPDDFLAKDAPPLTREVLLAWAASHNQTVRA